MAATAHDLAADIRTTHDITADAAAEAVETYVALIEDLEGHDIDRDAIEDLDAGFILMAVAVAQHTAAAN